MPRPDPSYGRSDRRCRRRNEIGLLGVLGEAANGCVVDELALWGAPPDFILVEDAAMLILVAAVIEDCRSSKENKDETVRRNVIRTVCLSFAET